jgi:aryl-alcohol dehydrogenase-like predicted oxidoreductase
MGQLLDAHGFRVVVPEPADRAVHMGQTAVGEPDLAQDRAVRSGQQAPQDLALDQGIALVPWSPLKNGFLSGKYRRGAAVTDSARAAFVGGPSEDEYTVVDAVAAIADEHGTSSAAVALAWLRARPGGRADPRRSPGRAPDGQPRRAVGVAHPGATADAGRDIGAGVGLPG